MSNIFMAPINSQEAPPISRPGLHKQPTEPSLQARLFILFTISVNVLETRR